MIVHELTPHLAGRKRTMRVSLVVLHATAGANASGAIATLRQNGLSYHYLIQDQQDEDGKIVKCLPLGMVAYHAGVSKGPLEGVGNSVNPYSVGISLVNRNDGKDPYSDRQFDAVVFLLKELRKAYGDDLLVTTHAIVSPGRKTDPLGFPAERAAKEAGLKFWRPG